MSDPDHTVAAELVATADRLQLAVDAAAWRLVVWLTGMAVATTLYLSGLGVAGHSDAGVLTMSGVFGVCVAVLCLATLPGAAVFRTGMERRLTRTMLGWALVFGAAMALGLTVFRGNLAYWLVAALAAGLPLAIGARAEARLGR